MKLPSGFGAVRVSRGRALAVAAAAVVTSASMSLATLPTMPAVTFPVDTASVIGAIAVAGGTILLLVWGTKISFRLANKLFSRGTKSI